MNTEHRPAIEVEKFYLTRGDIFYRFQQKLGLIPASGGGFKRRAIAYAAIAWLPLVLAAWLAGTALEAKAGEEPLLSHIGIHVRCLIAIPLLVLAEGIAQKLIPLTLREFRRSGLVDENLQPRFESVLIDILRLRNRSLPWLIIAVLIVTWATVLFFSPNPDEIRWTGPGGGSLQFGAWWLLLVTKPLFSILLLAWVWRLVLLSLLLYRISALPLKLVPSHPDRLGGLGFLARLPAIYSPFIFSVSAVMAGLWAHQVLYHDLAVPELYGQIAALLAVLTLIGLAPLLVFTPLLIRVKKQALLDYGVFAAKHGRAVDERWIQDKSVPDYPMLDAPELGPVADVQAIYQAVESMRTALISKSVLLMILAPAAIPLLLVVAMQWPLKSTLSKLLFTLL
ncbi:hypothetical protein [Achromobacter arsenitoxydans]|uniref:Transmembrane protein n=1 Tax=Achromobacter arsenitoxydans SY8 TaxID=477184 RepID=H0F8E5_9BURK|nr:hypothetical protein [Achromobacter arsenitoxydans]EHK65578.1 hypothetical protein KYC_15217 [Achromobacter arsenitoxydans SY8]